MRIVQNATSTNTKSFFSVRYLQNSICSQRRVRPTPQPIPLRTQTGAETRYHADHYLYLVLNNELDFRCLPCCSRPVSEIISTVACQINTKPSVSSTSFSCFFALSPPILLRLSLAGNALAFFRARQLAASGFNRTPPKVKSLYNSHIYMGIFRYMEASGSTWFMLSTTVTNDASTLKKTCGAWFSSSRPFQ